ncbi:hypothetical protein [Mesorhizobium cantuariense]|uniref:Uncharacterized protein n=1 Tax=Mesorhizobium cantuariense TaxID=1300275 RepID=A0ABV7MKG0_9HYPH
MPNWINTGVVLLSLLSFSVGCLLATASADEMVSACVRANPLETLSSSHTSEKLCDLTIASDTVEFFVSRSTMKHNPLTSSKIGDYFENFPSYSYKFDRLESKNLYRISAVDIDNKITASPLGISSYLFLTEGEGIWIRCNEGFDRKCSVYQDVALFNEDSQWDFCKVQIIARFDNPPSENNISIVRDDVSKISSILFEKLKPALVAACHVRGK